jgi:D-beta-D-heptose 7-phosphate kinase/D-beta-D-heptose 1-phosphate adenosyltransferase
MNGAAILVIGDIMLDRFVYGDADRISPEGPVPVLRVNRETLMLGGSGNVLANLRGLGVAASIISVIGEDHEGRTVQQYIEASGASADDLIRVPGRPTSIKTRFLANHQQLLRVDEERTDALPQAAEAALLQVIRTRLPQQKAVILSDYGKGVLSKSVIGAVIELASAHGIPVLVDPKGSDYGRYRGATIVTPNRKELADATGGLPTESDDDIVNAANHLLESSGIGAVIATRSQDGMSVIEREIAPLHLKTKEIEVFDVSGAGDTVIATVAAGLAAGAPLSMAATLANLAGGIVVTKVGTAAIRSQDLTDAILAHDPHTAHQARLCEWDLAREQVERWKARGLKVGFTNGCFDILHAGHVNYLNEARSLCDRLVLGLNHDRSVRLLKGPTRPVNTEIDRATVIGGLGAVDMVVLFGATEPGLDNTACDLIQALQPDIFFKGGDYTIDQIPEARIVQAYGGEVRLMGLTNGLSSSKTIQKLSGAA